MCSDHVLRSLADAPPADAAELADRLGITETRAAAPAAARMRREAQAPALSLTMPLEDLRVHRDEQALGLGAQPIVGDGTQLALGEDLATVDVVDATDEAQRLQQRRG